LGFGFWGLGFGPHPPNPNPQSPIPNPQFEIKIYKKICLYLKFQKLNIKLKKSFNLIGLFLKK